MDRALRAWLLQVKVCLLACRLAGQVKRVGAMFDRWLMNTSFGRSFARLGGSCPLRSCALLYGPNFEKNRIDTMTCGYG